MTRSAGERVQDIPDAIDRCQRFVARVRADNTDTDLVDMAEDAIERNLQVIGEAVSHLPADILSAFPDVPWPQIRGFRDVVDQHLPRLAAAPQQHRAQ